MPVAKTVKSKKPTVEKQNPKAPSKKKTVGSIGDRITDWGDSSEEGISLCLYGESGTGKSTLASTFPGPILWCIRSGGKNPGEIKSVAKEDRKKIKKLILQSSKDLLDVADLLESEGGFKTVVLDNCSGFSDMTMAEILQLDKLPEQLSWGLAQQSDWGQLSLQCKEIWRRVLDLSINRIFIAHQRDFSKEESKASDLDLIPSIGPSLTPALATWINASCDNVCQCFKKQKTVVKQVKMAGKTVSQTVPVPGVDYCLRTGPHGVFMTRFRVPRGRQLPDMIIDPDYGKLIKLIDE